MSRSPRRHAFADSLGERPVQNANAAGAIIEGCHYWLMVANNSKQYQNGKTLDVVSILVFDATGKRVAYGTGPAVDGDVTIASTSN
jgi:hypothetical protein